MNWKNTVSKLNAKHYSFPIGWDTRQTIAAQLECAEDRVDTLLAPGLKSGEIEKQQFPVWDDRLNRKTLMWGYRAVQPTAPAVTTNPQADAVAAVKAAMAKHPDRKPGNLRDRLPKAVREQLTVHQVREIMGL